VQPAESEPVEEHVASVVWAEEQEEEETSAKAGGKQTHRIHGLTSQKISACLQNFYYSNKCLFTCIIIISSRQSSVGLATGNRLDGRNSNASRGKKCSSSPQYPDWHNSTFV
jgi:hypothetical protein